MVVLIPKHYVHKQRSFNLNELKTADVVKQLDIFGFAVDEGVIPEYECEIMANALDEIEKKQRSSQKYNPMSNEATTLKNVHLVKPDIFLNKINITKVMEVVSSVFRDDFILSAFSGNNASPEAKLRPHIDSRIPIRNFSNTTAMVAMLCLDDFTEQNGATIVWPFSHKSEEDPSNINHVKELSRKMTCVASRGSIIYFLGQTWHSVGRNLDHSRRWGISAYYSRWWIKPTYDYIHCGAEIYKKLNPQQKILFGFTSIPPRHEENRYNTMTKVNDLPHEYEEVFRVK